MKKNSAKTKKATEKAKKPAEEPKKQAVETVKPAEKRKRSLAKFKLPKTLRTWGKESQFLATTLSIILTFGTTGLLQHCQRIKDRRMSALMVMSNIEQFSRKLEERAHDMARLDTLATWLLDLPKDSLDKLPINEMAGIVNQVVTLDLINHDKTAESIFSSSIETWKNMGYFQFIDNVGICFSKMNTEEEYWNQWVEQFEKTVYNVLDHPEEQTGKRTWTQLLNDNAFRTKIESFHVRKEYLEYDAEYFRYLNAKNMELIGISKDKVMEFTNERDREVNTQISEPMQSDFRKPQLKRDSLKTLSPIIKHIDNIIYDREELPIIEFI